MDVRRDNTSWAGLVALVQVQLPLLITLASVALYGLLNRPHDVATRRLEPRPDAFDYAYGAEALLHGTHTVIWPGAGEHVPQYPPGMSLLLTPLVALRGTQYALYSGWLSLLACAILSALLARRIAPWPAAHWPTGRPFPAIAPRPFPRGHE